METKQCCNCNKTKNVTHFNKRKASKDGYQPRCKACHAKHNKIHYQNNKSLYIKRAQDFKRELIDWYMNLKKELVCEQCQESRSWCLEFHHPDPSIKDGGVSQMVHNSGSRDEIVKEIEKCHVLCRNCHADVHYHLRQENKGQ